MTMKENPNATLYDSNLSIKEIYLLNVVRRETDPLAFEVKERDHESWNPKFVDEFSMDNQNGTRDSTETELRNGLFYPPSSRECERSVTVEEIPSLIENELKDSNSPHIASSDLIETVTNFYTDKNVLECNTPELTVCYKDINDHVVKDICVDEGMPDELKRPKSASESSCEKDLTQKVETISGETDETVSDGSAEDSFGDRSLPIQEFGMRSFLRSFIGSLDGEGNKVVQLPDQVSSGKPVSAGPDTSSAEDGPNHEDVQDSSLSYNSKVESKSITFNFKSSAPETAAGISNGKTENVNEQYVDSTNVLDHNNTDSHNLSDSSQVHCNIVKNTSFEKVLENSLKVDDQLLSHHKDENNSHDFDVHVLKVNNESVVSQEKYEQGESSFSDAGFIPHSGPIAFSGSISFRSDGSATSGRSFAFPILQSEWNSSPVRMRKADGRHFRKHKCWRSGLLCCRF